MAQPRNRYLRLVIPSLYQGNPNNANSDVWCGRTSASMIHNYYVAARAGGIDNARARFIINQRDRAPYDLVFADAPDTVAVPGFSLTSPMERAVAGMGPAGAQWTLENALWPAERRKGRPGPAEILDILAKVIEALDAFNPVLFYSGISRTRAESRHIIVISGYHVRSGELWLHIDDPSAAYVRGDDPNGPPTKLALGKELDPDTDGIRQLEELPPDCGLPDNEVGHRYWLRAARLFEPNQYSLDPNDCWCDHCDRRGFVIVRRTVAEPRSPLVQTNLAGPWIPLSYADDEGVALTTAWVSALASGAPYPLGSNLTWHDGIHLAPVGDATSVTPLAGGELLACRFPPRSADGVDGGTIIMRHRFDRSHLWLVDPTEPAAPDDQAFFSAILHLEGGSTGAELLAGRVDPGPRPRPFLAEGELVDIAYFDADDRPTALAAGTWVNTRERVRVADDEVEVRGADGPCVRIALSDDETQIAAWSPTNPAPLAAPDDAPCGLLDPLSGSVLALDGRWTAALTMAIASDPAANWDLVTCAESDGTTWVSVAVQPKVTASQRCLHDANSRATIVAAPGPVVVLAAGQRIAFTATIGGNAVSGTFQTASRMILHLREDSDAGNCRTLQRPCVSIDASERTALAADPSKPLRSHSLRLFDPAVGVVTTALTVIGTPCFVDGVLEAVPGNASYAFIDGSDVVLHPTAAQACFHDATEVDRMRGFRASTSLATYEDPAGITFTFGKTKLKTTATRVILPRPSSTGIDVTACVGLDAQALASARTTLREAVEATHGATMQRLSAGASRLVVVEIGSKTGFALDGGAVIVREGATGPWKLLHTIDARSSKQWYSGKRFTELQGVPADLRMPVLATLRKGSATAAIVEVMLSAAPDRFDDARGQAWDRRKAYYDGFVADLATGAWIDLVAKEREDPDRDASGRPQPWRIVARDPIGRAGFVGSDQRAIHVEILAETHFLPTDGPQGRWQEIGADVSAAPLDQDFAAQAVDALLAHGTLGRLPSAQPVLESRRAGAIDPRLWSAFCSDPEASAQLAEIVAVHEAEWSVAWDERLATRTTAKTAAPPPAPLAAAWPDAAAIGLPTGVLRFYHPLRFVEWLTTGIDVQIRLADSLPADVEVVLEIGEDQLTLQRVSAYAVDGVAFTTRMAMRRGAPGSGGDGKLDATVVVHGTTIAIPPAEVVLERGRVINLWLCEPTAKAEVLDPGSLVVRPVMPKVAFKGTDSYVLADDVARYPDDGIARMQVSVSVQYDRDPPTTVELALSGAEFRIARVEPGSYAIDSSSDRAATLTPTKAAHSTPATIRLREALIVVDLVAAHTCDATGRLEVRVSGGDLPATVTHAIDVQTRTIHDGDCGRDVAKVQLYLSQILASGSLCLRTNDNHLPHLCQPGVIDGRYGEGTALAMWRFVLTFAGRDPWSATFTRIATERGSYEVPAGGWSLAPGSASTDPASLLDEAAGSHLAEFGAPVIGAELIAELVRASALPNVLPSVRLTLQAPAVDVWLADEITDLDADELAKVVPLPGADSSIATLAVELDRVTGDSDALELDIVVGDGDYHGLSAAHATLAELVARGIELEATGKIDSKTDLDRVSVRFGPHVLGSLELSGTRDLTRVSTGAGIDAVHVRAWLRRWTDADGKPYDAGNGGKWDGKAYAVLRRFRDEQLGKTASYAAVLRVLEAGPVVPPGPGIAPDGSYPLP